MHQSKITVRRLAFINAMTLSMALVLSACGPQQGGPQRGAFGAQGTPDGPTPTPLPTRVVAPRTKISADGELTLTRPVVSLSFETPGRVKAVNVALGQRVKTGQVLAEVEDTQLREALTQARDQLAVTVAQIKQSSVPAKATDITNARATLNSAYARYAEVKKGPTATDIEQALRSWNQAKNSLYQSQVSRDLVCGPDKDKNIYSGNVKCKEASYSTLASEQNERSAHERYLSAQQPTTADKLALAWSDAVAAQNNLDKLRDGVTPEQQKIYTVQQAQAEVAVARAERNLGKAQLRSPCDCVVQDVTLGVGGLSGGASIMLLDARALRFRTTNLSELDVVRVRAGQPVTIRLKSFENELTGAVQAVLPISSGTQGATAHFTVLIAVDAAQLMLLPGMTGQVEVDVR